MNERDGLTIGSMKRCSMNKVIPAKSIKQKRIEAAMMKRVPRRNTAVSVNIMIRKQSRANRFEDPA